MKYANKLTDEELRELAKMELSEMEDMVEPLESELKILQEIMGLLVLKVLLKFQNMRKNY